MSKANRPTVEESHVENRFEQKIKRRAMPITVAVMVVLVLWFVIHYLFLADDAEDQVVAPTPEEDLREQ